MVALVREVAQEVERPIAVIADLQGPKVRIGELAEPVTLDRGEEVVVAAEESARDGELPVSPTAVGEVLQRGHDILIDDGLIRLRVESVERGRARCTVVTGGVVASHKGVNVPGVPVPIPSLTRKDMDDLDFALDLGVDFVALSFVRSAADVRDLKELIDATGNHALVIAKIEKAEAVDALDEILRETDSVMVARGDLGVEIGAGARPAPSEAHHPGRARPGQAGDHGDADARVDDPPRRPDARRGKRRRERGPRRDARR